MTDRLGQLELDFIDQRLEWWLSLPEEHINKEVVLLGIQLKQEWFQQTLDYEEIN